MARRAASSPFAAPPAYPLRNGVGLLDGDGMPRLGRPVVLDEHHGSVHSRRDLANKTVVGAGVAEDPASPVDEEHGRERATRTDRLHDANADVADGRRHGEPFLLDVGFVDGCGLHVVEEFASAFDAEIGEERWGRGEVGERLGLRLQSVVEHVGSFVS